MRCTRCDGLAVPQGVGIAPSGKVVFGYCRDCLADPKCRLVEVTAREPRDLILDFSACDRTSREDDSLSSLPITMDKARWIIALVGFAMIAWGLVLLTAGLATTPGPAPAVSPFGNGTMALLGVGGLVTALLGVGLLVLAVRHAGFPALTLVGLMSCGSLLTGLGLLVYGTKDLRRARYTSLVVGMSLAILISAVSLLLERFWGRALKSPRLSSPWKLAAASGKSGADGPRPLL